MVANCQILDNDRQILLSESGVKKVRILRPAQSQDCNKRESDNIQWAIRLAFS